MSPNVTAPCPKYVFGPGYEIILVWFCILRVSCCYFEKCVCYIKKSKTFHTELHKVFLFASLVVWENHKKLKLKKQIRSRLLLHKLCFYVAWKVFLLQRRLFSGFFVSNWPKRNFFKAIRFTRLLIIDKTEKSLSQGSKKLNVTLMFQEELLTCTIIFSGKLED